MQPTSPHCRLDGAKHSIGAATYPPLPLSISCLDSTTNSGSHFEGVATTEARQGFPTGEPSGVDLSPNMVQGLALLQSIAAGGGFHPSLLPPTTVASGAAGSEEFSTSVTSKFSSMNQLDRPASQLVSEYASTAVGASLVGAVSPTLPRSRLM
ncbi:unnamed protein product [Protopolystoma xenopodis]|uniref:Uncharacterized protein n=1 Tax=Protopolystoma xenopodis TaxID=117903 RepID=A0A448XRI8_9PLAT|nr:unnamed protein product [Protopolystoma xenopodis]